MTEIIAGIYQFQTPIPNNPLGSTNTYLIQGDNERLLIDPGMNTDESFEALEKGLAEIDLGFKDITQIIATHAHGDHYGLSVRIKQRSQARILMHHLSGDLIQSMSSNMENRLQQMDQWLSINGVPKLEQSEMQRAIQRMPRFIVPATPDITLKGDETISVNSFSIRVLWTPGHSPGHICLYESTRKILFSGDHILPFTFPNVSLQPQSKTNPLDDFINSVNLVKQLDIALVLPGHEHSFNDLAKRAEELIRHRRQRNTDILEAIKTEAKTAYQISSEIIWQPHKGGIRFRDLPTWDRRLAVTETLAHLESMRTKEKVNKFTRDNLTYYQLT
ncbi:MBL fold metallo-hydrolase [Chloroflexota bacterium]